MTWDHALIIALAGLWAGTINTVVGSGTLVTFPILVALGYPPVTATTSNAIGLIGGAVTGAYGYRHELVGQGHRVRRYAIASFFGAIVGTALLLSLPARAFESIVPVLVLLAVALVAIQPAMARWSAARATARGSASGSTGGSAEGSTSGSTGRSADSTQADTRRTVLLFVLLFLVGIYGGYFTAAQGVMLVGVMGLLLPDSLQRINAFKNALTAVVNLVAGAIYAVLAPINWWVVAVIAVSSVFGGLLGARIGRSLPPPVLRGTVIVIGLAVVARMLLT